MKAAYRVFGRLSMVLASLALVAACSSGGSNNPEEVTDTQKDEGVTDLDAVSLDSTDVPDLDTLDEVDVVDVVDLDETSMPDDGTIVPDEIDDEVNLPDEINVPDEIETCTLSCEGDDDCVGAFAGETTFCLKEKCAWDTDCGSYQCALKRIPADCCDTNEDCMDDNECTINETCLLDHTCSFENKTSPDCCTNITVRQLNFDDGQMPAPSKMVIEDHDSCAEVAWNIADDPCGNGKSLYLGDPDCHTYYCGQKYECQVVEDIACTAANQDTVCPPPLSECNTQTGTCKPSPTSKRVWSDVVLPEVVLPADSLVQVSFRLWTDTEPATPGSQIDFDLLKLIVEIGGIEQEVAYDTADQKTTDGSCVTLAADLSIYAGLAVDLRFEFDTNDGTNNNYPGVYLDDIRVTTYCDSCTGSAECVDEDKCTDDACITFTNKDGTGGFCANIQDDPFCWECAQADDCLGHGSHPGDPTCWPPVCNQEGTCEWSPNPACCNEDNLAEYWVEGFEGGQLSNDYTLANQDGSNVVWALLDTYGAPEDPGALDYDTFGMYFGNPATGTYDCGSVQCMGSFTTPAFNLTGVEDTAFLKLGFQLFLSTEFDDVPAASYPANNAETTKIDVLYVEAIKESGTVVPIWNSDSIYGTTGGEFLPQWGDLSQFKGQTIRLRFRFDTGFITPANNAHGGVRIDEIVVESVCDPVCSSAMDCESSLDCVVPVCMAGQCGTEAIPECCTEAVNPTCNDDDACTADSCNYATQTCVHAFTGDSGCCTPNPNIFSTGFEDFATAGWTLPHEGANCGNGLLDNGETCATCPADADCLVGWDASTTRFVTGAQSLYFGNPETNNYYNGTATSYGKVTSPAVQLPPYGIPAVSFELWLDTEHTAIYDSFVEPNDYDNLNLYVQTADSVDATTWSAPVEIWNSMSWDLKGSTWDEEAMAVIWKQIQVGMNNAAIQGKAVRFIFEFDGYEPGFDNYEGAYIDDFRVFTLCDEGYECLSPVECAEGNPSEPNCTIEMCDNGNCISTPNSMKMGCCEQQVIGGGNYDFDGPCNMESWTATPPSASVKWQVDNSQNHTGAGQCAMYFGNTQTHTYNNQGFAVSGLATSPAIDVTGKTQLQVSFWLWADLSDDLWFLDMIEFKADYVPFVGTTPSGNNVTIWQKPCSPDGDTECVSQPPSSPCDIIGCEIMPNSEWNFYTFDIDLTTGGFASWDWSVFPAQLMVFKFEFQSFDALNNMGAGVYIDDFKVQTVCQ